MTYVITPDAQRNVCCKYWIYSNTSDNYTVLKGMSRERIADSPDNALFHSVLVSEECDGMG